ncbi:paf acetylhydrolase family protein [Colletotrichum musicola]|uniref:1-alkyl-2-acetylglycerophosphocholine esterase n=1 Tax=Colletotrichum musicola TaxID=2175873 RepID=A0A8H6KA68_9PEZI|nr:paf acetylhydrolase family protein [Colletotrichum musicola]
MILPYLAAFVAAAAAVVVPGPPGPYSVSLKVHTFTDTERLDEFAPEPENRRILTSIFLPNKKVNCSDELVDYMPPATAKAMAEVTALLGVVIPDETFLNMEMEFCKISESGGSEGGPKEKYPLLLFGPGLAASRHLYNVLGRAMASYGYVVVNMDVTYNSYLVEFPDGSVARASPEVMSGEPALVASYVQARQKDISFVIDQLTDPAASAEILAGTNVDIDGSKIFAFGHSLGGNAAASALYADERVSGALNFDGMMLGPVTTEGVERPLILVGRPDSPQPDKIPSWNQTFEKLRGPGLMVGINGTQHMSFIDLDLPNMAYLPQTPEMDAFLGSIDRARLAEIIHDIVRAVLDFVFDEKTEGFCNIESFGPDVELLDIKNAC